MSEVMKKNYNQPSVEVMDVRSGEFICTFTLSAPGGGGHGGGKTDAPRRRGDIIP